MTGLAITALVNQLAVAVYNDGLDSEKVSGLCHYIKNDANITLEEYESLDSGQKNLLNGVCQYTGPVEMAS